jgi:hypothetical protein
MLAEHLCFFAHSAALLTGLRHISDITVMIMVVA